MLLAQKFKTYDGALKRARFENAIQIGEVKRGDRARAWNHSVVQIDGFYRIMRQAKPPATSLPDQGK